jgi:nucleotide-binding universal stress UspA family protein
VLCLVSMKPIKKILVAIDESPASRSALTYAVYIAQACKAHVELVHVSRPEPDNSREVMVVGEGTRPVLTDWVGKPKASLSDLFAELEEKGRVQLDAHLFQADISQAILTAAVGYDLLVLGTHGRTGVAHAVKGSIAENVVRRAQCPVITVHAGDEHMPS